MHPLQQYFRAVSQVLLKWSMQRGVPVIPKATSREHLAENFADMFNWRLTNEQKVRGLLYYWLAPQHSLQHTCECGADQHHTA